MAVIDYLLEFPLSFKLCIQKCTSSSFDAVLCHIFCAVVFILLITGIAFLLPYLLLWLYSLWTYFYLLLQFSYSTIIELLMSLRYVLLFILLRFLSSFLSHLVYSHCSLHYSPSNQLFILFSSFLIPIACFQVMSLLLYFLIVLCFYFYPGFPMHVPIDILFVNFLTPQLHIVPFVYLSVLLCRPQSPILPLSWVRLYTFNILAYIWFLLTP